MIEVDRRISSPVQRGDVEIVQFEDIPGRSPEEKQNWLINYKAHASRPRKQWSIEDLMDRFLTDEQRQQGITIESLFNNDVLTVQKELVERRFNRAGYEIERRKYSGLKEPFHINERHLSEYDEHGYLTRIIHIGLNHYSPFIRRFDYRTNEDNKKELMLATTQEYTRNGVYMELWAPIGQAHAIDFSEVPLKETTDSNPDDYAL